MKKILALVMIAILMLSICATAFAADTFYLRYVSNTKWNPTNSTSTRGSGTAKVAQVTNGNTETGAAGGKVTYGCNTSNSTSSNKFTANYTTSAGIIRTIYPSVSSSVTSGTKLYLNAKANTAPATGQWEISGNWHA